ncbi:hypothetical protein ABEL47_01680 [Escherichia coli]
MSSLKRDMRNAEETIRTLRASLSEHQRALKKYEKANEASQMLILMLFNDVMRATKLKEFKSIQEAVRPLMEEKAKHFDICLPLSDDEKLVLVNA